MAEVADPDLPPKMPLHDKQFPPGNSNAILQKRLLWSSVEFLRKREQGSRFNGDTVCSNYYKHMSPSVLWDSSCPEGGSTCTSPHGAIFNLGFSPCGSLLVAVCQGQSLLLFDPTSHRKLNSVKTAHTDCVNCVRFLDSRTFAVCSDDESISLWDARKLDCEVLRLRGHTNWVKSIEFHAPTRKLVSSAFDDTIRVWDVNSYGDSERRDRVVLRCPKLTRMKLSPDGRQMVVSAIPGTLIVIHNLDLDHLLDDSKESFYDLESLTSCGVEALSGGKRNSFEVLDEFPDSCLPWCISSLEIHPHGWGVLSRFTNRGSLRESTAFHEIQYSPMEQDGGEFLSQRLTHGIEEPNTAKGFIKEQCFSSDGQVICSPFGNAARLLAFGWHCKKLHEHACTHRLPSEFHELRTLIKHRHSVLTCKFSPTQMLLATGCLGGCVCFHQPQL